VLVEPGTGYDLLLSALAIADRGMRGRVARAAELQRRADAIDPAIPAAIRRIGREPFISLMGWAHAKAAPPTAARLLEALAGADPRELLLAALGYHRQAMRMVTAPETIAAAADGDARAIREMRRTSYPGLRHWQVTLRHILGMDAGAFRDELVAGLGGWHRAVFAGLEAEVAARQAADAAVARDLVAERGLLGALEVLAPGMTFARDLGESLVVLAPSVVLPPGWALTDYGSTLVIAYPVMDRGTPEAQVERLARLADALGDPVRVRVLRELRTGPRSTSDLARRLGVPRTSLQHHIAVLLHAGLATMAVDDASTGRITVRPEALAELARLATSVPIEPG
jgi:DNA-binding transcriptional ArsR family regulator